MVTRLVLLNVPPVYVPLSRSIELAPGVELVKLTTIEAEVAPGAMLPTFCGSGVPFVEPSCAVVSITLLAGSVPVFWMR